jgi:CheY-like chemotaxis protein
MINNKHQSVLVIDDCQDNLLLMKLILQSEGYKFNFASSGREGLAKIAKNKPDLIILDLMMPDISGLEVIKCLKNDYLVSNIPILLLTANADYDNLTDVDALCYKPYDINYLLLKIESLLELNKLKYQEVM